MAVQILRVLTEAAKTNPTAGLADSLVAIGLLDAPVTIPQQHIFSIAAHALLWRSVKLRSIYLFCVCFDTIGNRCTFKRRLL